MGSIALASITLACLLGGVSLGAFLRRPLPDHHLADDSKNVVKMGTGLIATLSALVLGLLISAAKNTFDSVNEGIAQCGADIVLLDGVLSQYGPETGDARRLLRRTVASAVAAKWPEQGKMPAGVEPIDVGTGLRAVHDNLLTLSPRNDAQRSLQSQAASTIFGLRQVRWKIFQRSQFVLPLPFLIMLIFWLTILFTSFGLLGPPNPTNISALLLCAVSVSGAVFLLLEMSQPTQGIMKASCGPLVKALELLGG